MALSLMLPGCSSSPPARMPSAAEPGSAACAVVTRKCSRCHESERIASYRAPTPRHWQSLVARMRRQRGSHIDESDGRRITACLVMAQFGRPGLDALDAEGDDDESP